MVVISTNSNCGHVYWYVHVGGYIMIRFDDANIFVHVSYPDLQLFVKNKKTNITIGKTI